MSGPDRATIGQISQQAHHSARKASPWLVGFGRLGHLAEGLVYGLIGVLAVQVALGRGGATTDNKGALTRIAEAPFGRLLLIAVTLGILGFALWRFLQAILDTDNVGTEPKGLVKRLGKAASGVAHIVLALSALQLLRTGSVGASSSTSAQSWTARLLSEPFGRWLVAIIGLGVIGVGCYQLYKGAATKFLSELNLAGLNSTQKQWVTKLGQLGHIARGLVFGMIGLFLIVAALRTNAGEARGLDGVLATLAQQPFGPWLLGAVATGLIAFGLYLLVEARYRRMVVS